MNKNINWPENPLSNFKIVIGANNYQGTASYLTTNHSDVFSTDTNDAGLTNLCASVDENLATVDAEVTQYGTSFIYICESLDFVGGRPATPPFQKPKP